MIGEENSAIMQTLILVEQLKLADSGNLEMQDNKAFEEGAVYRFTIDVTNGNANADLKVEKIN